MHIRVNEDDHTPCTSGRGQATRNQARTGTETRARTRKEAIVEEYMGPVKATKRFYTAPKQGKGDSIAFGE